ncbi:S9 family peptidase [Flavobacterium sp. F372]|uniref:S9 family peptidase n=1 Tax=Flavobacterium bernardetii TaxID=2813823 RepID=A0ABR7J1N1_9FLAO|nr:prolyl oligopeptidase family serine peptidase [Flavobacterium bernardetii]MBC5835637.1 S9 family peptidase [Flavobacterium bernardetii]NHF71001.1 S9 family peptidase [Flavobacterium bernardetii]
MKYFFTAFLFAFTSILSSQNLQLEEIMKGNEFIGQQPSNQRWSVDGKTIYFDWNPKNEIGDKTYYWQQGFSEPKLLSKTEFNFSEIQFQGQEKFDVVYYTNQGALFSYHKKTKENKVIYQTTSTINSIQRSVNPNIIYFQQNRNIFKLNVLNFELLQLTNFKSGTVASENTKDTFLTTQQKELFQFVNEENAKSKWNEKQSEENKLKFPSEIFYNTNTLEAIKINPSGKFVTYRLSEYPTAKETKVENFITSDGYTKNKSAREKVSINNISKHNMYVYNVEKDTVFQISFSKLIGIKTFPKYYQEYENLKDLESVEKAITMQAPVYNATGDLAVFEARSLDNKDRWILQLNLETATITELDYQHDDAWIGGPGIPGYNFNSGTLGFLADNKTIYFQSEATGFSHLYTINLGTKKKSQLTQGKWEVRDVVLSKLTNSFYITTTETHPGNRSFYKLDSNTGKKTPILTNDGAFEIELSPDETKLAIRYSYINKPWEIYVADNKSNPVLKQITFSTSDAFKKYNWKTPEVISFKATDGTDVYARVYNPKKENKNKAAIIFVHGAGYLQNAHKYWSTYHREYMFHNMLSDLGYTVLDIDYRASDGYGRDFRTGIYRHMGGLDLQDQLDGKKYLVEKIGIDANKVGIYGGSYGGFITLMGLLTKPGEFKAGAALRSVTDWAHYNQGYTSNILNFPETDVEAYKKSSPIYFANNLQDKLLMLHGMVDDNVQFQDIVRMTQRFIELGKKDWDLAVFPVEAHGFQKSYSWTDEYRRILELFNETLLGKK